MLVLVNDDVFVNDDDDDDDEGDDDEGDDDESVDIFKRACLIDDRPALWSPFHPDCCYCCCY